MAASSFLLSRPQIKGTDLRILDSLYLKGLPPPLCKQGNFSISERLNHPSKRNSHQSLAMRCTSTTYCCSLGVAAGGPNVKHLPSNASNLYQPYDDMSGIAHNPRIDIPKTSCTIPKYLERMMLADLDPPSAKLAIGIIGPFLSAFAFLFIIRIVMSWYPKLPVGKFPYVIAYAPTEPLLIPTRKLIPPLGGVDVTPVVWFGLVSFLSEILVGPQGLLVLLSQQV